MLKLQLHSTVHDIYAVYGLRRLFQMCIVILLVAQMGGNDGIGHLYSPLAFLRSVEKTRDSDWASLSHYKVCTASSRL